MHKTALGVVLLAAVAGAQEQQSTAARFLEAEETAFRSFRLEQWDEAIAAFERQIAVFAENPRPYYNIACCYARQGKADRAGTWLSLAIARGWRDARHLRGDTDFDLVRDSAAFKACMTELLARRVEDPDPQPRAVPVTSVPSAESARSILGAAAIRERVLARQELLLGADQYKRRLFRLYDRRMAMLTRYLAENGDARDADDAAHARVQTAMLYLARSADDANVRAISARYVLRTADQFLQGWGGSPLLHEVRFWRAHAEAQLGRARKAEARLRSLLADHPRSASAPRSLVELCVMLANQNRRDDLRRDFAALRDGFGEQPSVQRMMRERLMKARLFADGIPEFFELDPSGAVRAATQGYTGLVAYLVVSIEDEASGARLDSLRKAAGDKVRVIVISVDDEQRTGRALIDAWFEKHAAGLPTLRRPERMLQYLWLRRVPTLIVARGGTVLAVDPTDDELAGHIG